MTQEEANICHEYHLPVDINKSVSEKWGLSLQPYYISQVSVTYQSRYRQFLYSAVISANGRALYSVDIEDISCAEGYEGFMKSKVRMKKNELFRSLLSELVKEYKTKKAINQIVSKEIDKIKGV